MRILRPLGFVTLLCLLYSGPVWNQQAPPSGTSENRAPSTPWTPPKAIRDPQALTEVQDSIAAMGGVANISAVQSCLIRIQDDQTSIGRAVGPLTLEVSGSEFRSDFEGPNGTVTFSTGAGTPFRQVNGMAEKVPSHVTRAWFWPQLVASELVAEFENPNYSFEYKGTSTAAGPAAIVIATKSEATRVNSYVTPQTWYFDAATALPIRVEYRLPGDQRPELSLLGAADLSKYQAVSGVLYPFESAIWIGKKSDGVRTITSVEPNASIPASEFAAPLGEIQ